MKAISSKLSYWIVVVLAAALAVTLALPYIAQAAAPASDSSLALASQKTSTAAFHDAMRRLWEDHVFWTRLYIISAAHSLPDQGVTAQRLLQNQADIGNAIRPYYGDAAADKLTSLLRDHILLAARLIDAAKSGDQSAVDAAAAAWYANANDIAVFLSSANPKNWPLAVMQANMKKHLDLTLQEAVDRLHGSYSTDIQDFDLIENHILSMADLLSSGIIKQFPDRFTH